MQKVPRDLQFLMKSISESNANLPRPQGNYFFMRRLNSTQPGRFVLIDFSPIENSLSPPSSQLGQSKIHPTFYKQGEPFMPTFGLPIDDKSYSQRKQAFLQIHERKKLEAIQQKEELFIPMPTSKTKCCCVCKVYYDDYLTHIKSTEHREASQNCEFNKDIFNLCAKFDFPKKRRAPKIQKDPELKNEKPRKKRKTQKVERNRSSPKMVKMQSESITCIGSEGSINIDKNKSAAGCQVI